MYFPIGWPKVLHTPGLGPDQEQPILYLCCNRDRTLFAFVTPEILCIWFCKPCVPIVFHRRNARSIQKYGSNILAEWKPDSTKIVVATSDGHLLFYNVTCDANDERGLYVQTDSPHTNLRRDSAELFIKETIPSYRLSISEEAMVWDGRITDIACITMTELMVSTEAAHVLRYKWDGTQYRDYNLDLRRIPFCINQQVSKAVPIVEENVHIVALEYSPLVGGFAVVLNDGRAAFLTASSLKFDPNQVQGIWAQNLDDATCSAFNHKYRLITFGRANSQCIVYYVDDTTGGLEVSHCCMLSNKDYPGDVGSVSLLKWTPDGCAMVVAWSTGGFAIWSTFGSLLMCTLAWDYGLNVDLQRSNPLKLVSMEFSIEGYQLWMIQKKPKEVDGSMVTDTLILQLDFVKSVLSSNPSMSHQSHLYLMGDDKIYINFSQTLIKAFSEQKVAAMRDETFSVPESISFSTGSHLAEGRQWLVVCLPSVYSSTNWPLRYAAIDESGENIAIAGRSGMAHYSMSTKRWKVFGNESQEKDFIVCGGLMWWPNKPFIILACYSITENTDELRLYNRDNRLDNKFAHIHRMNAAILQMSVTGNVLVTFGNDGCVSVFEMESSAPWADVTIRKIQIVDLNMLLGAAHAHPTCVTSVTWSSSPDGDPDNVRTSVVVNISGRLFMVQTNRFNEDAEEEDIAGADGDGSGMTTVLASCVENLWIPNRKRSDKVHLTEAMWLYCGVHGMRVWLPLYPRTDGARKAHTFMSKRIMLPFHLKIYPLSILFEAAIILGAENDTILYTSDSQSKFSLPFSILQRTSQVYLHQILRQLICRNLGYHAWEIARSCTNLPYFPHSLELLLHEVLDEEATSKQPIPDAQLPSIIEFIHEFPHIYLQTIVQCARKTEIALWPYLFAAAGKPRVLFEQCMLHQHLDTAASYLIILQNLEASAVSRQHATILLNTALDNARWDLAKDLVRFLRAIDPTDVDVVAGSVAQKRCSATPQSPTLAVQADEEQLQLIMGGATQRVRHAAHHSEITQSVRRKSAPLSNQVNAAGNAQPSNTTTSSSTTAAQATYTKELFIDVILQKHARRLLSNKQLKDLGRFAAYMDFHLVHWLGKERDRAARVEDFVQAVKQLHDQFNWPYPTDGILPQSPVSSVGVPNEERLRALKIDVSAGSRIGDSGYMSYSADNPGFSHAGYAGDAGRMTPLQRSLDTISTSDEGISTVSHTDKKMALLDGDATLTAADSWSLNEDNDNVTWEVASLTTPAAIHHQQQQHQHQYNQQATCTKGGSQRSEVQLRYLFQMFLEAGCLEWALILAVTLCDTMAVVRCINATKSPEQTSESVTRLRQGLLILHYWTDSECLGYRTFMATIQSQVAVLTRLLDLKIQIQRKTVEQSMLMTWMNSSINTDVAGGGGGIGSGGGGTAAVTPPSFTDASNTESRSRKSSRHESIGFTGTISSGESLPRGKGNANVSRSASFNSRISSDSKPNRKGALVTTSDTHLNAFVVNDHHCITSDSGSRLDEKESVVNSNDKGMTSDRSATGCILS